MIYKYDMYCPAMLDAYIERNTMWFSNTVVNALMKVSLLTGELLYFHIFKDFPFEARSLHQTIFKRGHKIILCPDVGSNAIIIFDEISELERKIEFENEVIIKNAFIIKNELWLFPTKFSMGAYILNFESLEIRKWDGFYKSYTGCSAVCMNEKIFALEAESDLLIEFDYGKCVKHNLGCGSRKFIPVEVIDDYIIVGESKGEKLWRINLDSWECRLLYNSQFSNKNDRFMRIRSHGDWLLGVKKVGMSVVLINIKSEEKLEILIPEDYIISWRKDFPFYFRGVSVWNDKFVILPIVGDRILILDPEKREIKGLEISMSEAWEKECYNFIGDKCESKEVWGESEGFSIKEYIKYVRYKS